MDTLPISLMIKKPNLGILRGLYLVDEQFSRGMLKIGLVNGRNINWGIRLDKWNNFKRADAHVRINGNTSSVITNVQ